VQVELASYFKKYRDTKRSFAVYRLPDTNKARFVGGSVKSFPGNVDFKTAGAGFVIKAFDSRSFSWIQGEEIKVFELEFSSPNNSFDFILKPKTPETETKETYTNKIQEVIHDLIEKRMAKVVISRRKDFEIEGEIDLGSLFQALCKAYTSAFVSLVYLASLDQIWIGASPEILVSENQEGLFTTVALAGTQSAFDPNGAEISPVKALWTHKEIEEQALVSRYIIDCLKKIRVREYLEKGPKTIKAGNLLHLKSTYTIDSRNISFQNLSSVMLNLLHPTSAVCGMPKEPALDLITKYEKHSREYYAGYLGPVNIDSQSHIYVNLRTLKIQNQELSLFAGGGITEDSNPEKEWLETEMKMKTLLNILDRKKN
jgi:isochorismate synthase